MAFLGVCAKCGDQKDVVAPTATDSEQAQLDEEMKSLLKSLPERKRRTFVRFMNKKNDEASPSKEELLNKLETLKVADDEDGFTDEESDDSLE
ncbi:hypothetical protein HUJ04_003222 [Dendroctonus ponderosae]|nr:hypothetical protein HUJ04_003222 [Dendroctonus ponderosae]